MNRISKTAKANGWGSDPYKWVSGLTPAERAAVKNGELVVVTGCRKHAGNPSFRAVRYEHNRYVHRVPSAAELFAALDAGELEPLRAEIEAGWMRPQLAAS